MVTKPATMVIYAGMRILSDDFFEKRNNGVGTYEYECRRKAHADGVRGCRCDGERRAGAEHQAQHGVLFDAFCKFFFEAFLPCYAPSFTVLYFVMASLTAFVTARLVMDAPVMASISPSDGALFFTSVMPFFRRSLLKLIR